jgi:RNA polymerase sigma-70 factor (ECF subfamily)
MSTFKSDLTSLLPNLRAFARSLCGDGVWADDLVQEAVMRAWANREKYQEGTNLKAWLFTILRNHFYNEIRKNKRYQDVGDGDSAPENAVHESQLNSLHLKDLVRELGKLPADQREALILTSVDGFSYDEAAIICGCAVGTIKSRVARARRELEAQLGGADIGPAAAGAMSSSGPDGKLVARG